ncbi:MAG: hypothetical protein NC092_10475 [Butyrivibrio sp.]|nr:hypothetical protein [Muribaculum sp.]MCM1553104.1 hypothetical protein [Butyrivibrio sp.]
MKNLTVLSLWAIRPGICTLYKNPSEYKEYFVGEAVPTPKYFKTGSSF